jgi:hypothetical protein
MSLKNFVVKNGLTVGLANIDAATGNLNTGNANLGNLATANFFNGTIVAAASSQPNITSVGTLTGLTVSGVSNLGPNGNVIITGGTNGQFLQTNGSGNLSWTTIVTSGVTNGTSNISIPVADGNVNTSVGGVANVFVVTSTGANVTGTLNASGNANVGNLGTAGLITATGNVAGGNLTTAGAVVATGNVTGGNLTTAGVVAATGNVSGGNITTVGLVNATGNVTGGNLTTAGVVAATGNVTGGNLTTAGALSVTGNANVGNIGAAAGVFTANVSAGNLSTTGSLSATGNVDGGNVNATNKVVASQLESNVSTGTAPFVVTSTTKVTNLNADLLDGYTSAVAATGDTIVLRDANGNITANNIGGTLSTAAQPSITSVGTLTSLDVTGNITTSANLVTDLIVGKTSGISIAAAGTNQNVTLKPTGTGFIDVFGAKVSNVATPVASTDAATKGYVDAAVEGLHIHAPSQAATPNTLAVLSSGTVTYNNGSSGVGATLTTTGSYTTIDGVNIATVGTRILVKNEANAAHNGIYTYTSSTVLTRATDFDTPTEMGGGDFTFVQAGTLYNDTGWVMTDPVTTVGTTAVNFVQFSGAGTYTAGTGLTLNGTEFSISNTAVTAGTYGNGDAVATFTVNAQGQLTNASNTFITANAANLTGTTLNASVITSSLTSVGTLGSLAVTGNASAGNISATGDVSGATLTGTLTTASQPNITSVGTLTSLSVTGNVSGGNLTTTGVVSATGNVSGGNITTAGVVAATGNVSGGNITTAGLVSATGNVSGGNITTVGLVNATGNVTGGNLTTAGLVNATGNVTGGNITTAGVVAATGNVSGGNLTTAGALSVTGNANVGNIGAAAGVFTSNISALNANLGNLASANFFSGDGGLLSNVTAAGNLANGTSNVRIPTADGNVNISVGGTSNVLVVTSTGANVTGTLNATGNANVGNIGAAAGVFTTVAGSLTTAAQGNITSVGTLTSLDVSGNITAPNITANTGIFTGNGSGLSQLAGGNVTGQVGNALVAGTVYTNAQPNITSVGTLTSLAVTGNASAGNLSATGDVSGATLTGTLTTAAQPNITSVGTLTSITTSGNATVGGNVKVQVGITSNRANVSIPSNNAPTIIDQFNPSDWRTAKYVISTSGADGYQSVEALLIHDGTDAYITVYGSICSNNTADIINLTSNINGVSGNVAVYAASNSASCVVNLVSSYIKT